MKKYQEITRIPISLKDEGDEACHVKLEGNEVVVFKWVEEWKDVTDACYLEFRDSQHTNGKYIAIVHSKIKRYETGHVPVAIIGVDGMKVMSNYRVEKAQNARISFKILEKNT